MKSRIRWGRVIAAAVLSEAGVIAVLLALTAAYSLFIAPGRTAAEYQAFGARAGYYAAPAASGLATFLCVLWVARKLTADFVAHGALVGIAAVMLSAGFLFGAKPEDRLVYLASYAIRLAAGYLGGLAAQARFRRRLAYGMSTREEAAGAR